MGADDEQGDPDVRPFAERLVAETPRTTAVPFYAPLRDVLPTITGVLQRLRYDYQARSCTFDYVVVTIDGRRSGVRCRDARPAEDSEPDTVGPTSDPEHLAVRRSVIAAALDRDRALGLGRTIRL